MKRPRNPTRRRRGVGSRPCRGGHPHRAAVGAHLEDPHGEDRPFPIKTGHESSGVIAALSAGVTEWAEGDSVYGLNDWFADGAQAEYCVAPAAPLAPKPRSLDHVQAAGLSRAGRGDIAEAPRDAFRQRATNLAIARRGAADAPGGASGTRSIGPVSCAFSSW
jgi:hypothetical protein